MTSSGWSLHLMDQRKAQNMPLSRTTILEQIRERVRSLDFLNEAANSPHLGYVAGVILDSSKLKERALSEWVYKPYIEFAEEEFVLRGSPWWTSDTKNWETFLARDFSDKLALEAYCSVRGFGLTLYVDDGKGGYREADDSDPDYAFIKRMFVDEKIGLQDLNVSRPPLWAKNLFVYRPNLEAYRAIAFQQPDPNDSDFEAVTALKQKAIRWLTETSKQEAIQPQPKVRAQGPSQSRQSPATDEKMPSRHQLTFRFETRALQLVAEVQERYLGSAFDPQDTDTRPAKAHVLEWLRNEKGVASDAEAAAIDRIAMPFSRAK